MDKDSNGIMLNIFAYNFPMPAGRLGIAEKDGYIVRVILGFAGVDERNIHDAVKKLLPWVATGTADRREAAALGPGTADRREAAALVPGTADRREAAALGSGTADMREAALGPGTADRREAATIAGDTVVWCETEAIARAAGQIGEYIRGGRPVFDLPLRLNNRCELPLSRDAYTRAPFSYRVWHELMQIPVGRTRSYSDVAAACGNPKACRAVGMANNRNPIPIVVPCHRVIGKDGSLTGYAGGLEMKRRLLDLEQRYYAGYDR